MKSTKQRRQEIKARRLQRARRPAQRAIERAVDRPIGTAIVTPDRLRPTPSHGVKDEARPIHLAGLATRSALMGRES